VGPSVGPSGPPGGRDGASAEALADALAAEHAAIYAYGPIGARLEDELADAAREAESAHRDRRDALVVSLARRRVTAPGPHAAYDLPFPVAEFADALRLAVLVEERVAAVWRAVLARSPAAGATEGPTAGPGRGRATSAPADPGGQPASALPDPGGAGPDRGGPDRPVADREVALAALVDAAVRATRWRAAAGIDPATVPFPGQP
jgi:hypothetical protein